MVLHIDYNEAKDIIKDESVSWRLNAECRQKVLGHFACHTSFYAIVKYCALDSAGVEEVANRLFMANTCAWSLKDYDEVALIGDFSKKEMQDCIIMSYYEPKQLLEREEFLKELEAYGVSEELFDTVDVNKLNKEDRYKILHAHADLTRKGIYYLYSDGTYRTWDSFKIARYPLFSSSYVAFDVYSDSKSLNAVTVYKAYPKYKTVCDYLTGKRQSCDFSVLQDFYNKLKHDNVVLKISYEDVKPGKGNIPFYCNGIK